MVMVLSRSGKLLLTHLFFGKFEKLIFGSNGKLRDGSDRDLAANMDVVLDIRHKYDLDLEDVTELLNFRIALIPKSWEDKYGDTIRKNGQEVADCLNSMLNNNAKVSSFYNLYDKLYHTYGM